MKIRFDKITEITMPERDDSVPQVEYNRAQADEVLRNWCAAAAWGLPLSTIADMLDEASKRLRSRTSI